METTANIKKYLEGGDLRSIGRVKFLIPLIRNQQDFDLLFRFLHSKDRIILMRAADAVEKITIGRPQYLQSHKSEILDFFQSAEDKEFKWHLSQMVPRLSLTEQELEIVLSKLNQWAGNPTESRIVRVNALQAISEIVEENPELEKDFKDLIGKLQKEEIASINARIRKLSIK
ncbi:hypothetical protein MWU78_13390 [Arenibacter sp. F26102]|uniref:hypothetical protein n=1 Tax=Arenibacter sp. F26102 TaxID=2926416 RepID=UPI001FF6DFAC|nr:hypothetical protein [Arenibacter sp. F26102]MCK0146644.1 hypothetical protein [Arenibacter sp. F26102]